MTQDPQERPRRRGKLWLAASIVGFVLALIVVPPLIGISRYKSRITHLVSVALGRPVRLSGVELRLLPRPGFVLSDLTVEEDPTYGSEPVLHANTVNASIRFASLWRGKLQISRISVDEASLNVVRAGDGRWNLDSLFRNAAAGSGATGAVFHPYLEATNSRINIKNGIEKLPFSLLDADASLWEESDGEWRVRLEGQPARTDVSLDLEDTGVVQLEGTLRPAAQLNQMPIHVDAEWRDAQFGQLSRLLLGSDEGWRGNLSGELHLDGTAAAANVQARLRATGVHREEFAPAAPLDFDATCSFLFHYTSRGIENIDCNSPVGDGRVRLTGAVPRSGAPSRLTVQLERIPAQVGLDVLRTVRSKVDASLQATGTISGRLSYDAALETPASSAPPRKPVAHAAQTHAPTGPLSGSLTVDGLRISGDSLSHSIQIAHMTFEPAPARPAEHTVLVTLVSIPAGGSTPLTVRGRLALAGFEVGIHGPIAIPRLREFAAISGSIAQPVLNQLAGEPVTIDVEAAGPWVAPFAVTLGVASAGPPDTVHANGTIVFRGANWKPAFLANAVLLRQATLHLENGAMRWDPIDFAYGPIRGSATLAFPASCDTPETCAPQFTAHFATLDTAELQSALLGARDKGTLLSSLLDRFKSSSAPAWPQANGIVQADSLLTGPFTFASVSAEVKLAAAEADLTSIDATSLGGKLTGAATLQASDQPQYSLNATFAELEPALVGRLLGMKWSGGKFSGSAKLKMSGYSDKDLSSSAKGSISFTWSHGAVIAPAMPPALAHFDRWTGVVAITDDGLKLGANQLVRSGRKSSVHAAATFGLPATVEFPTSPAVKSSTLK